MTSIFDQDLPRNEANYAALSPLSFIERTAEVYPNRLAIVHGDPPWPGRGANRSDPRRRQGRTSCACWNYQ